MTTFQTYWNKLLAAAAAAGLACVANGAVAHSVVSAGEVQHALLTSELQQQHSVEELVQQYSLSGVDALLERAQRSLPPPGAHRSTEELLQAAWLAQAAHEFALSRDLLAQVLEEQPNNGQAWLLEAAVAEVVGDRSAARHACGYVLLSVSPEAAVVCFASLADTTAQKLVAYKRLQKMPRLATDSRLTGWRWSVQGELARDLGHAEEAEAYFRQAIAIFPAVQTRAMLMDLYLQQQRYGAALALTDESETVPALAVRSLLAQRRSGRDITAKVEHFHTRFQAWLAADDYRHAREMAMFYLDIAPQAELAFHVATMNAKLQAEPEDLALLHRATVFRRDAIRSGAKL